MSNNIFRDVNKNLTEEDIKMMNAISLAFVGDAVFELFVRTEISDGKLNSHKLHIKSSKIVNAKAQSEMLEILEPKLSHDEKLIVRRGKNAKPHTIPKNADLMEYKNATALEALFGYLFLLERYERLAEIYKIIGENHES